MSLMRHYFPWAFILLLLGAPMRANGQQATSRRRTLFLDGNSSKLVGFDPGEGEKLGINVGGADKADFIAASAANDVQCAMGLKDPLGRGPDASSINKRKWLISKLTQSGRRSAA